MAVTFRVAGVPLAYEFTQGVGPVVVFCSGFNSEMNGTKALNLRDFCASRGQAFLRFDYSGHGASGGKLVDGCVSEWAADAAHIIETVAPGRHLVLVGSSMGGWIALLLGRELGVKLAGLLLIAPAPDFTEALIKPSLNAAQREMLAADGVFYQPSEYGAPTPISAKLIEDGAGLSVLGGKLAITCPVRILHGMQDGDVPYELSQRLLGVLDSQDVQLTLIKNGDHRLSTPDNLLLLRSVLADLIGVDRV
jgi:pimeloyl-ACP methyl ester carboxylesterase